MPVVNLSGVTLLHVFLGHSLMVFIQCEASSEDQFSSPLSLAV